MTQELGLPITKLSNLIIENKENDYKLFGLPALTTLERNAIPAGSLRAGLLIYSIADSSLMVYTDNEWSPVGSGGDTEVLILKKFTTAERLALIPETGMMVFDTDEGRIYRYNASEEQEENKWAALNSDAHTNVPIRQEAEIKRRQESNSISVGELLFSEPSNTLTIQNDEGRLETIITDEKFVVPNETTQKTTTSGAMRVDTSSGANAHALGVYLNGSWRIITTESYFKVPTPTTQLSTASGAMRYETTTSNQGGLQFRRASNWINVATEQYLKIPDNNTQALQESGAIRVNTSGGAGSHVLEVYLNGSWTPLVTGPTISYDAFPVGTLLIWPSDTLNATNMFNWRICNGALLSKTTYNTLFGIIGTLFGVGTATQFNIPDFRGLFLRGKNDARLIGQGGSAVPIDPDKDTRIKGFDPSVSGQSSSAVGSIQGWALGSHGHLFDTADNFGTTDMEFFRKSTPKGLALNDVNLTTDGYDVDFSASQFTSSVIRRAGTQDDGFASEFGSDSIETRPINIYVNYIIKVK